MYKSLLLPASTWLARLSLLVGVLITSLAGILIKVGEQDVSPFSITFNRLWIAGLAFLIWEVVGDHFSHQMLPVKTIDEEPSYKDWLLLTIAGLIRATAISLWAYSLLFTSVTNFTLLHNFEPIFIPLIAIFYNRKIPGRGYWLGWLLSVVGLLGLALEELHITSTTLVGDEIALSAAFLTTFYYFIKEKLVVKFTVHKILMWVCFIGALFSLPLILLNGEAIFPHNYQGWFAVILLALLCQFLGHGLITYALKCISAELVMLALPMEVILAAILSRITLNEVLSIPNYLCCGVIVIGMIIATSSPSSLRNQDVDSVSLANPEKIQANQSS